MEDEKTVARRKVEYDNFVSKKRQELTQAYGEKLGEAYLKYVVVYMKPEDVDATREAFADAVVSLLEEGTHEEKVSGIVALLKAIETKTHKEIADATRQAVY